MRNCGRHLIDSRISTGLHMIPWNLLDCGWGSVDRGWSLDIHHLRLLALVPQVWSLRVVHNWSWRILGLASVLLWMGNILNRCYLCVHDGRLGPLILSVATSGIVVALLICPE